ncbi:MAG: universal stress protein, partial [Thermodesulfobacteriota bacterium]|nr:universal stress protein [Thermodesulfobacteriota bacterium]
MQEQTKKILVPVDGSINSQRSLEYLTLMYDPQENPDLTLLLLYVLPILPRILTDDEAYDVTIRAQMKSVEEKHVRMAEQILGEAKRFLEEKGFREDKIRVM